MTSTYKGARVAPFIVRGESHEISEAGAAYVEAELAQLAEIARSDGFEKFSNAQAQRVDDGVAYLEQVKRYDRMAEAIERTHTPTTGGPSIPAGIGQINRDRGVWAGTDLHAMSPGQMIDRAHRAVDATHKRVGDATSSEPFERVEIMLGDHVEATRAASWAIAASDPAYESAFAKVVRDVTRGHLEWNDEERHAFARVQEVSRAMSLTGANGGFMVPLTLDPAIMLTSAGSINPMRELARVVSTTTNAWQGVSSAGVTATWRPEAEESTDDSPTLGDEPINVHTGDAFVPFSYEWGMDASDGLNELGKLLSDAADQLMAEAYTVGAGDGSDEPTGYVTALDGTASEVAPTTPETFADTDVYALLEAVPPRFRARAAWIAELSTMNIMAQFETGNGARLFPEISDGRLLMRQIAENSSMDAASAINTGVDADNFILAAGDWQAGFVIVDRVGTTVEIIPHMMGANNRPTRQRGMHMWFRTGSGVVNPNALRLLNVATAA